LLFFLVTFAPYHLSSSPDNSACAAALAPSILICEFYPHGLCDDEYVVLFNGCGYACNLKNWSIGDGEGAITIMRDTWLASGARLVVSSNSSSYLSAFGYAPSIALDVQGDLTAITVGTFRLGDQGDCISLASPQGLVVDSVCYGRTAEAPQLWFGDPVPEPKQGEVIRRVRMGGGFRDTDRFEDWTPFREFRYGYTEMPGLQVEVGAGNVLAFTSPDSSLSVLQGCVARAQLSIRLCAYEASSRPLCYALLDALSRGVEVRILVDGAPAGGLSDDELRFLSVLTRNGADVRALSGNASNDIVQHVWHLHAKYGVFDLSEVVVMSENLVESALPTDQLRGNRGWGVQVANQDLASHLGYLFDSDARAGRPDVRTWASDPRYDGSAVLPTDQEAARCARIVEPRTSTSPARVSVYISPDCSESSAFLCDLLGSSRTIVGEQFQADLEWTPRWSDSPYLSPLVSALVSSVNNGSDSRMLFDSSWFNVERNGAVCEHLRTEALSSGTVSDFRMMSQEGPIEVLHNKGLVIDGRFSVITSNNWVFASFARNRELALVVDSPEVASFFSSAFGVDWSGDEASPVAEAGDDLVVHIGDRVALNGSHSRDDLVIASWSWDLYSDGQIDSRSPEMEFFATQPGRHKAILIVEDAWGKRDTDEVEITVMPPDHGQARAVLGTWLGLFVAVGGAAGCVTGAYLARSMRRAKRARLIIGKRLDGDT